MSADESGYILQDRNIVLVVDDDLGVLKGVQRLLRAHAYEPILFSSAEALKITPISKLRFVSFSTSI